MQGRVCQGRDRRRLAYKVPELQAAWISELIRTAGMMADMLAERIGRNPGDARVRMYTGALIGTIMAAMVPMLVDPEADFVADMDAALDFMEGGLPL